MSPEPDPAPAPTPDADWDVLVVGRSYAGLSAALTLGRTRRATLLVGTGGPRNQDVSHTHGLLTRDGAGPGEFVAAAQDELARYETVQLEDDHVTSIEPVAEGFRAHIGPRTVTATAVVLTTGVNDDPVPVPGLAEHWGRGVFTCPYCDGWEHRDGVLAALAPAPFGPHVARILTMLTDRVLLLSPVEPAVGDELVAAGVTIEPRPVARVVGDGDRATGVELEDGTLLDVDAIFGASIPRPNSSLAASLGCELDGDGFVVVGPDQSTSVPGVYAAGDVTARRMFTMAAALASGAMAAVAANNAALFGPVSAG